MRSESRASVSILMSLTGRLTRRPASRLFYGSVAHSGRAWPQFGRPNNGLRSCRILPRITIGVCVAARTAAKSFVGSPGRFGRFRSRERSNRAENARPVESRLPAGRLPCVRRAATLQQYSQDLRGFARGIDNQHAGSEYSRGNSGSERSRRDRLAGGAKNIAERRWCQKRIIFRGPWSVARCNAIDNSCPTTDNGSTELQRTTNQHAEIMAFTHCELPARIRPAISTRFIPATSGSTLPSAFTAAARNLVHITNGHG